MARNTRRTNSEIETFIKAWLDASSTRDVARALTRARQRWPYSVEVSSVSQFATQLRTSGISLPYMDNKGNEIDADYFNALIASS
tara:strand:- start:174 stop:428 length:255 start_codon:yes stop_codon:yes gene_type:complete